MTRARARVASFRVASFRAIDAVDVDLSSRAKGSRETERKLLGNLVHLAAPPVTLAGPLFAIRINQRSLAAIFTGARARARYRTFALVPSNFFSTPCSLIVTERYHMGFAESSMLPEKQVARTINSDKLGKLFRVGSEAAPVHRS